MNQFELSEIEKIGSSIVRSSRVSISLPFKPIKYFRHGWQSWSLTAWTGIDSIPTQRPKIYHPLQIDAEYAFESHPNGSWLGAVEFKDGNILFLGALGTDAHVFLADDRLSGRFESGEGDWFISFGEEHAVFAAYADHLGGRFGAAKKSEAPRVWCSWYSLYTMVDEQVLGRIFEALEDMPFDVLQVDDGWQQSIGDWIPNSKFPSGLTALAGKIRSGGRRAGLWLAPLIATRSSRLFREHPDWFLRDNRGRFVSAGFNWGEQLFALDTTHPDVTAWMAALMKTVRDWGFDYLKLDFLYAGALKGKRYKDIARERAYRESLRTMRESMGADAFFLACGTPIIPALGLCDAMRVGADVAHEWEKHRDASLLFNFTTPGTKNAIRTTVHRLWLSSLVHIDPDVAYFAKRENSLTEDQKALLQDLALICNFKATSDPPQWMTEEERRKLREFLNMKPRISRINKYTYELDGRLVDFTPAVDLPEIPKGFTGLWAAFLGWLGSAPFILRIIKRMDDNALKKRRVSL